MGVYLSQTASRNLVARPTSPGACLISVDAGGCVRRWTTDAEVVFGHTTERAEGLTVEQLVPFLSERETSLEGWCRRVDGSVFRGLVAILARPDEPDAFQVFVVTDITSRYMREQTLQHELDVTRSRGVDGALEAQLRAVLDATGDGVMILDAQRAVAAFNPAATSMFRCADRPPLGAAYSTLLDLGADALPATGTTQEAIGRRADASTFTLECSFHQIDGGLTVVVMRDVTQRRSLERQLLEVSEQLQRQIGQDLHDGLGQLLTGTAFLAKGLQHGLSTEHQGQAQRIVELINLAIARVRSLARGLSPIHVEAQRLEEVLRSTLGEASELLGVSCELELRDFVDNAQATAIAQLCLIAREAITNAVRHGQARHIVVRLARAGEQSVLSVEDDGVGIGDVDKPLEGLGLRNMRYRAKMIDGKLEIIRTRSGTTVRCSWRDP
ncbi:MAG TPA: ATP-binding protein [Polyangiales bacterium]|nr:ATP-binding protein [Polyangiales bacterium]